jgi:hypothetical protein
MNFQQVYIEILDNSATFQDYSATFQD